MNLKALISRVAALALVFTPGFASAQSQQDLDWCNGKSGATAEQRIAGCSSLLRSGNFKKQSVNILTLRALAYKASKRHDEAIEDFTEALRIDPQHADAWNGRGETHIFKRDYQKAYADYDTLTQVAPTDWRGFNGRAVARGRFEQDPAKKIADLQKANQLAPNHPWPLINLSEIHTKTDQTALALRECAKVKELAIGSAMGFRLCGAAYLKRNDLDAAMVELNAAIKLEDAAALYLRGLAEERRGNGAAAKIDKDEALRRRPDVAESMSRDFDLR